MEAGIEEVFRCEGPALDDLDGGVCRGRRGRMRGGDLVTYLGRDPDKLE